MPDDIIWARAVSIIIHEVQDRCSLSSHDDSQPRRHLVPTPQAPHDYWPDIALIWLLLTLSHRYTIALLVLPEFCTMNRLFGESASKPKPNLSDAIAATDVRIDSIEVKIRKLDAELTKFRDQMKRMKDGPGKVSLA